MEELHLHMVNCIPFALHLHKHLLLESPDTRIWQCETNHITTVYTGILRDVKFVDFAVSLLSAG